MNSFNIRQIIFDTRCILCESKDLSNEIKFICNDCLRAFDKRKSKACRICGHPLNDFNKCGSCIILGKVHFDDYKFIQYFSDFIKTVVYKLKKDDNFMINKLFFELILKNNFIENDGVITVVPDNFFKRIKKGRTSLLYLLFLFERNGFKVNKNILKRKINFFGSQKNKSGDDRIGHIEELYYLPENQNKKYSGKVYLIDDVYTTGATMNYCSKLLKEAGFKKVHAISFVRALLEKNKF